MLKIESNLKINGRHWGLQFADGIAYTANIPLAAKLLLKGYVVTDQPDRPVAGANSTEKELSPTTSSPAPVDKDQTVSQPDQPVAGSISKEHELSPAPSSAAPADKDQTASQSEPSSIAPAEIPAPKPTKSRKKVTTDAADAG